MNTVYRLLIKNWNNAIDNLEGGTYYVYRLLIKNWNLFDAWNPWYQNWVYRLLIKNWNAKHENIGNKEFPSL